MNNSIEISFIVFVAAIVLTWVMLFWIQFRKNKPSLKVRILIITFRFLAARDVLFSERFELTTYFRGQKMTETKFDKTEKLANLKK